MSESTDDLTTRMRAAAETLSEVAAVLHPNNAAGWCRSEYSSSILHQIADRWDREATEKAAEEAAVEELARELHMARIVSGQISGIRDYDEITELDRSRRRMEAGQLIKSGYRKGGA